MRKIIGFWGFILSCSLLSILNLFTSNEWISIIPVFGFVLILLYNWDDMKQYSKKSIGIMIGIIVVCSLFVGVILIEGQKQMEKMSIFSRMDVVCKKSLYCNCSSYFSKNCYKHSKLHIKGEVEWGSTNERENRILWCARLFTIISYFRAIF